MSALKKDSSLANTITSDFRQFLEVFQFQSYYETRPMKYFGIVRHVGITFMVVSC
jgi:hypothetical protein